MADIYLSNVPFDCKEPELQGWIESHGFPVDSIQLIQDLVAGVSPAFAYVHLRERGEHVRAVKALNGQNLRGRAVRVQPNWKRNSAA
jgi:RNA recognition motif-containing protein